MRKQMLMVALGSVVALAGCDKGKTTATASGPAEALPAGLVVAAAPEGAVGVSDMKLAAAPGQHVVVTGVVAGSKEPIAANRAVFTLADVSLETCDKMDGKAMKMEKCDTPWDACCSDPSTILAKSMTVQVVGPDGKPLHASLKGAGGLNPLKRVAVKGTVQSVNGDGEKRVVTVNADAIYVSGEAGGK